MLKRNPWPVILQVIPELHTGGAERTTIEVAEAIRKAGGRALVLSEGGSLERDLAEAGGELLRFPAKTKNPAAILMNAMRMRRIIYDYQVSLVHARSRAPAWSALIAARRTGRVFVTTYHGIYGQKGRLKSWYNGVMARGDAVIANSDYTAATIRERHAIPEERLRVIPRGVDLRQFSPEAVPPERVEALRAAWGVDRGDRVILLAARLTRWKGQHLLIEAIARMNTAAPLTGVKVVLAGDDQGRDGYCASLRALIGELGLTQTVRLAGHCRDMPAAYLAADIAVVPSIEDEAFGRVSIEAQAMGCPVVASSCGALPETMGLPCAPDLENGVVRVDSGWLFRCNDGPALAEALTQALVLTEDERREIAHRAMRRVAAAFSTAALQMRTLEVYDGLLGTQLARSFKAYAAS
jgi:glycosyltransferase involved in cell wall biosynthesis